MQQSCNDTCQIWISFKGSYMYFGHVKNVFDAIRNGKLSVHAISLQYLKIYYNMTVWILAGNCINFSMAAGLIRLHMPGVK